MLLEYEALPSAVESLQRMHPRLLNTTYVMDLLWLVRLPGLQYYHYS